MKEQRDFDYNDWLEFFLENGAERKLAESMAREKCPIQWSTIHEAMSVRDKERNLLDGMGERF